MDSNTSGTTTTLYIGSVEKITQADGSKEIKRYIGGVAIMTLALDTSGATQSSNTHYLYKDHLGSLDIITDAAGQIVQEQSFDAWGQRRDAVNWQDLLSAQLTGFNHSVTTRGFTGHEMLDEVGIIHMNGRIYDPKLGRFLQADPFIQEPTNTQSLNRYSYVLNNPLNATDPSGYFVFTLAAIALTATEVVTGFWAVVGVFAAAGFADALLQGASFNQALFAGVISGVSAAAFSGIGAYLEASYAGTFAAGLDAVGFTLKVGLHGITGGITSVLQGGKFGHGFAAAGFTALSSSFNNSQFIGGEGFSLRRVVVGAVLGGTASKLSGGKFANGAVTGAFSQALNNELTEERRVDAQEKSQASQNCDWSASCKALVLTNSLRVEGNGEIGDPSIGHNTKEGIFSCQVQQCSGKTNFITLKARVTQWQFEGRGVEPSLILWGQKDVRISPWQIKVKFNSFEVNSQNYKQFNHFGGKYSLGDALKEFANE